MSQTLNAFSIKVGHHKWDEFSPYSSREDWDNWVSSTDIEAKLQSTRRPRRTQRGLQEESGVNFELKEIASIPADNRNEFPFTFEDSTTSKFFFCWWLLVVLAGFGWFWLVPCFSNYQSSASNTLSQHSRISYRNSTKQTKLAPDHLLTPPSLSLWTFQLIIHCKGRGWGLLDFI